VAAALAGLLQLHDDANAQHFALSHVQQMDEY